MIDTSVSLANLERVIAEIATNPLKVSRDIMPVYAELCNQRQVMLELLQEVRDLHETLKHRT